MKVKKCNSKSKNGYLVLCVEVLKEIIHILPVFTGFTQGHTGRQVLRLG